MSIVFFGKCKKNGIPLWQCPPFLFLVMGLVIIFSSLITWSIGSRYIEDPQIIALVVLVLTAVLIIIAFIISKSFEKLAEISRMKSEFVSIVSHQLKSPLTSLRWAVELLTSESGQEKQTEYLKIVKDNSNRMIALVSDLLMVSRLETASLPLKKQDFSLPDLIKDLIAQFEPFCKASNLNIEFNKEENLPLVFGDSSQVHRVVENLLDNAVRYTKKGGEIKISVAKKNSSIYFEIQDNGIGIPEDDHKYIFQKFFMSKNSFKEQTKGTGLGLYISKSIIKRSGGEIGFTSQEGKGSTFWFTLPIKS